MTAPCIRGSATSKSAALSLDEATLQEQEAWVIEHLRETGGSIDWNTWQAIRRKHHEIILSSVHRARIGLTKKRLVRNSGRTAINPVSGRRNTVWELGAGEPSIGSPNKRVPRPNERELRLACDEMVRIANLQSNFSNETWRALVKVARWLRDIE